MVFGDKQTTQDTEEKTTRCIILDSDILIRAVNMHAPYLRYHVLGEPDIFHRYGYEMEINGSGINTINTRNSAALKEFSLSFEITDSRILESVSSALNRGKQAKIAILIPLK